MKIATDARLIHLTYTEDDDPNEKQEHLYDCIRRHWNLFVYTSPVLWMPPLFLLIELVKLILKLNKSIRSTSWTAKKAMNAPTGTATANNQHDNQNEIQDKLSKEILDSNEDKED